MAQEVRIAGTGESATIRNPLGVVGLSIITLGIYFVVWYFKVNNELAKLGQARNAGEELGTAPTKSALAMFPGALLLLIPSIVSFYGFLKRLNAAQHLTGESVGINPLLVTILWLIPVADIVAVVLAQNSLNNVWESQA